MAVAKQYENDVAAILDHRHDNDAVSWATPDGRWGKGSPSSTFDCAIMLSELGMKRSDPVMKGMAEVLLAAWRGCITHPLLLGREKLRFSRCQFAARNGGS